MDSVIPINIWERFHSVMYHRDYADIIKIINGFNIKPIHNFKEKKLKDINHIIKRFINCINRRTGQKNGGKKIGELYRTPISGGKIRLIKSVKINSGECDAGLVYYYSIIIKKANCDQLLINVAFIHNNKVISLGNIFVEGVFY